MLQRRVVVSMVTRHLVVWTGLVLTQVLSLSHLLVLFIHTPVPSAFIHSHNPSGHVHTLNLLPMTGFPTGDTVLPDPSVCCMCLSVRTQAIGLIPGWVEAGEEVKDGCSDGAKCARNGSIFVGPTLLQSSTS